MGMLSVLGDILILALTLVALVFATSTIVDIIKMCDDRNLQTKEIIVVDKFIVNKGLNGDCFCFLDEEGVDYELRGGHNGARYAKLKLNQSYKIWVSVKFDNASCKEVLVERGV